MGKIASMKQSLDHALGKGKATNNGNSRVAGREQYYTPTETSLRLTRQAVALIPHYRGKTFIEPAAGTGSFVKAFGAMGIESIIALDIEPKFEGVLQTDFLEYKLPKGLSNAVAISNPPFGRNHSLSIPFFNKLAPHCSHIGFVVPRSWRKWSIVNRLDKHFHLILDEDVNVDYVDGNGGQVYPRGGGLKTIFQLWERREGLRPKVDVVDRKLIERTRPDLADISLTVFGRGCGTFKREFPRVKNTTQMFLKVLDPIAYKALEHANLEQFYSNVAFVEALSWDEINYALNEYLDSPKA